MDTTSLSIMEALGWGFEVFATSVVRYFLIAGLAFVTFGVLWRKRFSHRQIRTQVPPRKKIMHDIGHSMSAIFVFALVNLLLHPIDEMGLITFKYYWDVASHGWAYFSISVVGLIVFHDAYIYWTHRLIHHKSLFRRVHRVHHHSSNPNPFTAYAVGIGEALIHAAYLPLVSLVVPFSVWAMAIFLFFMMAANVYLHLGFELLPKNFARSRWTGWMASSTFHNLHHQRSKCNFAAYFTWWDRLCGTTHPDYVAIYEQVTAKPLVQRREPTRTIGLPDYGEVS